MLNGDAESRVLYDEGDGVPDEADGDDDSLTGTDVPFPLLLQQAHDPRLEQSMEESTLVCLF